MKIGTFLEAEELTTKPDRKTKVWAVRSSEDGTSVGQVLWYSRWRTYVFQPDANTVFHGGCLCSMATFLDDRNSEHREEVKARRARA